MSDALNYGLRMTAHPAAALAVWTLYRWDDLDNGRISQQRVIAEQAIVMAVVTTAARASQ